MPWAQGALDKFNNRVRVTGGWVQPDKMSCYLVDFVWHKGKWEYVKGRQLPDEPLTVEMPDGSREVERLDPSTVSKILRLWIAPDGMTTKAVEEICLQTEKWADCVRSGHLHKTDAWIALKTTITKQIEYPLLALNLSEDDCDHIEHPIL
uniref:Uncharacterized protein n=1 Tax=Pseudictyota dubia TaxID=2749911 RepID=A0A7R9YXM2_9STRA|mmetsp:Transcript_13589/g.25461  ORF Transcript_13589/g.25461 Transcript_13589/m.25461 type:complete len:150 (+) Transcript_13589:918-1367(+)